VNLDVIEKNSYLQVKISDHGQSKYPSLWSLASACIETFICTIKEQHCFINKLMSLSSINNLRKLMCINNEEKMQMLFTFSVDYWSDTFDEGIILKYKIRGILLFQSFTRFRIN
jgi:hypothetical protein